MHVAPQFEFSKTKLSSSYITRSLDIYVSDFIYLEEASLVDRGIIGKFTVPPYVYTGGKHLTYLTGVQLILLLSQLGYVLTRSIAQGKVYIDGIPEFGDDTYFRVRDTGNIMLTRLTNVTFRKKITQGSPIELIITVLSAQYNHPFIKSVNSFQSRDLAVRGSFELIVQL
jgi:hypothetical protein